MASTTTAEGMTPSADARRTAGHQAVRQASGGARSTIGNQENKLEWHAPGVQDQRAMPGPRRAKQAMTIRLPPEVIARARSTIKEAGGRPFYLASISDLIERAVVAECDRIDAELARIFAAAESPSIQRAGSLNNSGRAKSASMANDAGRGPAP